MSLKSQKTQSAASNISIMIVWVKSYVFHSKCSLTIFSHVLTTKQQWKNYYVCHQLKWNPHNNSWLECKTLKQVHSIKMKYNTCLVFCLSQDRTDVHWSSEVKMKRFWEMFPILAMLKIQKSELWPLKCNFFKITIDMRHYIKYCAMRWNSTE